MKCLDIINSSKKMRFYGWNMAKLCIPKWLFERKLESLLNTQNQYDRDYIVDRVNYYCKLDAPFKLSDDGILIGDYKYEGRRAYFLDLYAIIKYFGKSQKIDYLFGDIRDIPNSPTIVKSRPICDENQNAVLLKLNKVRHYNFVNDPTEFKAKKNMAVWRGACHGRLHRKVLLNAFHDHPKCNIGDPHNDQIGLPGYKPSMSFSEQLDYKFILSIEGTDVATSTKWIMSSNSLCFMPKPKFETWFMEGRLIPNEHYVLLKDDGSDLEEKIDYYTVHTEEALKIIENSNKYVTIFKQRKQERLISLLVMEKYLKLSKL
jgi:hypothetical protein